MEVHHLLGPLGVKFVNTKFSFKNFLAVLTMVTTVALGAASSEAFAKRVGGGKSMGKQSEQVTQRQSAAKEAGPSATPQVASPAAGAMGAAAAQPARNRWLGPIAGIAAGLGLAALASHFGMGEAFGSMMTMVLFGIIALVAIRFFMARRKGAQGVQPAYAGSGYSQTQMGPEATVQRFSGLQGAAPGGALGSSGSMIGSALAPAATLAALPPVVIPAGFDTEGFLRQAKAHFMRLQASFDAANLDDLREFTSPEMFAELQLDIQERNGAVNKTEVIRIDAELLGVHSNTLEHMASVRFQGSLREQVGAEPVAIDEVWNLTKPLNGHTGWVLGGIQQLS
jgi:predicted lipid-binding transport protein (Tim44 family)